MNNMNKIYASGTVGDADRCVYLEGAEEGGVALEGIMANSLDYNERLWSWLGWRTNVGDALRPHFETYVEMKNKWAQVNGFEDYGQYWRRKGLFFQQKVFFFRIFIKNYETIGEKWSYSLCSQESFFRNRLKCFFEPVRY